MVPEERAFDLRADLLDNYAQVLPHGLVKPTALARAMTSLQHRQRWHWGTEAVEEASLRFSEMIRIFFRQLRRLARDKAARTRLYRKSTAQEEASIERVRVLVSMQHAYVMVC